MPVINTTTQKSKYQLGLALSGGGARGFSHLGTVKALYEKGCKFDLISGTSMGAIIGAILADGYHPDEIMELLTPDRLKTFVRPRATKEGLMTMENGLKLVGEILHVKNIEDLKTPFVATATDILLGKVHYFTQGNILDVLKASASIPVAFQPTVVEGRYYMDGGVLNNLPVRCIRKECEKIIGIHVNPESLGLHDGDVKGMLQIAERAYYLCMHGNILPDKQLCDLFIEHDNLDAYTAFDFVKMKEIVEIGYKNTLKVLANKILPCSS